ncbi:Asp-tRNA(Asn)/Glu-tRNA(Gln) amidotransferase subunit GatB [candidate division NPL-UPA2 bacterium]|nr:Asp-tRNA(Asn)/Glu-tRNA(Gln) amidotransferase subunit GatB [candidate division NPL-UPA2 bacterium]
MNYQLVVGLEVHAELSTESKVFCGCSTRFGEEPNSQTCPVCLGLPGALPVLNKKAVEYAIRAALAMNCEISRHSQFDRKNYYYPDLPKNYQISQNYLPFASDGCLNISIKGETKRIGINNIHLEEDAGKSLHGEDTGLTEESLVDFNRAGVPLIEIVTRPDMHSLEEVKKFMTNLRDVLLYLDICDCHMEEGSIRFEANISLRPEGESKLGNRVEVKNLNSFKMVLKALEYEMGRQENLLQEGRVIKAETRLWNEAKGMTSAMRGKEGAPDYRYFPEPDLVPLVIDSKWIEEIKESIPELPQARKMRLMKEYGIPEYDASVLTANRPLADFYEETAALFPDGKMVSNWVMVELLGRLNERNLKIEDSPLRPSHIAEMFTLIKDGLISGKMAKDVFTEMFDTGKGAGAIVEERGWTQISDESRVREIVEEVIRKNPKSVKDFQGGKQKALGFLVGQVMKETRGKANPQLVNKMLREKLQTKT